MPQSPDTPSHDAAGEASPRNEARRQLQQALSGLNVEGVCRAYLQLRLACGTSSLEDRPGEDVPGLPPEQQRRIAAAFAERHCFMCGGRRVSCESCDGTGRDGEDPCTRCAGMGTVLCDFCEGSGWAGLDTVPVELRNDALRIRLAETRLELQHVTSVCAGHHLSEMLSLPAEERSRLTLRLARLKARIDELIEERHGSRGHLVDAAEKLEPIVARLWRSFREK